MIELKGVSKQYGRKNAGPVALRDVTLSIPAGSVWGVIGPNGAGKSTLLGLVLGFLRPSAGTVTIADVSPRDYLRMHGASYLPERFALPPAWRVEEAVQMLARLDNSPASTASDTLTRLGLDQHARKRVRELSRGLLQRLGLAQALLARRGLVVLDEPTEGLDPIWRIALRDIIADLRAGGATILISSHDLGEVERITDRAVILEGGAVSDIIDTRSAVQWLSYRITLATSFDRVREAFPAAVPVSGSAYTVAVTGPVELNERLGALIALGGVVTEVAPLQQPLEERVRALLREDA
jgi:ABC-type multidrug transport system ATPase subunit